MINASQLFKSGIALFSETLWLYFGLALFAKIQWEITLLPEPAWFTAAALGGYLTNFMLGTRSLSPLVVYGLNTVLFLAVILPGWRFVPAGEWAYGLALSIVIGFIYFRSSYFVFRPITRVQMLLRLEGNIMFYLIFTVIMIVHPIAPLMFHFLFAAAIVASLAGMVLTLLPEEQTGGRGPREEGQSADAWIETRVVGGNRWLSVILAGFLGSGLVLSLLMMLSSVRSALMVSVTSLWEGFVWAASLVFSVLYQLLRLLPEPDGGAVLPPPTAPDFIPPAGAGESEFELPLLWVGAGIAVLLATLLLWRLSHLAVKWKLPKPNLPGQKMNRTRRPLWAIFLAWMSSFLNRILMRWLIRFPNYYSLRIYWYFYLFQNWGRKKGFPRYAYESAVDYVKRVTAGLELENEALTIEGKTQGVPELVHKLAVSYSYAYYGNKQEEPQEDFRPLMTYLKSR